MRKINLCRVVKKNSIVILFYFIGILNSYSQTIAKNTPSDFWEKVQFGGGFGLNLGSGYTEIALAPSAIYPLNRYISVGTGLIGSYTRLKNQYSSSIYGVSAISLFNPIEKIQLSLELEQIRVNTTSSFISNQMSRKYWNTGLYVGAGYRNGNVTLGARYNLLFDKNESTYSDALMPFIRFYF
jgi:long-subunit fatty acid transport protein